VAVPDGTQLERKRQLEIMSFGAPGEIVHEVHKRRGQGEGLRESLPRSVTRAPHKEESKERAASPKKKKTWAKWGTGAI